MDKRNTKEFKALQKQWYDKLKESGFEDAEQDEDRLLKWHSHRDYTPMGVDWALAKIEYYRLAGQFLFDHKFQNEIERFTWQLHSEGISVRNITAAIKAKGLRSNRDKVEKTIKRLKEEMKKYVRERNNSAQE